MRGEVALDLLRGGLGERLTFELLQVRRPVWIDPPGQFPAGPSPGGSALRVMSAHPGCEVLEMPPWISEKPTRPAMPQDPANRPIRQGMARQEIVIECLIQPRPHRTVQHQQCLGGQALQPPRLRTAQGQFIEIAAPGTLAEGSQHRGGKSRPSDVRQMRTRLDTT